MDVVRLARACPKRLLKLSGGPFSFDLFIMLLSYYLNFVRVHHSPFFTEGTDFQKDLFLWGEISNLLGGIVNIWLTNTFSSNLNTIKLKIFLKHGRVYTCERKFTNCSGDRALSSLLKHIRSYFLTLIPKDYCVISACFGSCRP